MTTILYRGNFMPGVADPWSTEHQIAATLEAMGHTVIRAQEVGRQAVGWEWVERAAAERRPDLFLWTQTGNIDPDGAYRALVELDRLGVPTASYHLDLFWGLGRQHQIYDHPFWRTDYVFTADGGHPDQFRRARVNHYWAEPATYEGNAVVGQHRAEYAWPLVFTGSHPYPHEEHRAARTYMIDWLKQRYGGRRFRVYTGGIRNRDHADLCASATIVIGDSCLAGRLDRYWSERIPETLGRGGFLIHPYCPGLDGSYRDGAHLRWYDAGDMLQLTALVDHYLARPDEAARMAAAGRAHVLGRHLYRHRLARVLQTVGVAERSPA